MRGEDSDLWRSTNFRDPRAVHFDNAVTRPIPRYRKYSSSTSKRLITAALVITAAIALVLGLAGKSAPSQSTPGAATLYGLPAIKVPITVPKDWKLTFDTDFSGNKLNAKVWADCYWWSPGSCTNNPYKEREWYQASQVQVTGGALHLVAEREPTEGRTKGGKPKTYSCRSGMVTSAPSFNFKYGIVQIVTRIPYGIGLWPALWLAASNHQWPPEIDILEHVGFTQRASVFIHPVKGHFFGGPVYTPGNLSQGWHTFQLSWTKNRITSFIDGVQVYTETQYVPQQAMYLIANLADLSTAPGSCTGTMLIKSVKVWQP